MTKRLLKTDSLRLTTLKLTKSLMTIDIKVYTPNEFTKFGKLKKRAQSEMGMMMVDVEPHTPNATDDFLKEVADKIKRDYHSFSSPYIFTHIIAKKNNTNETRYIFETCNDLTTSPIKLLELLKT